MYDKFPRILILGGTGMLGSMLWSQLSLVPGWVVRKSQRVSPGNPYYFNALDKEENLISLLQTEGGIDYVVNAIGIIKSEINQDDRNSMLVAEEINSHFPKRLAKVAEMLGVRIIHISTDGVFSGKTGPYDEFDVPDPNDFYGQTKLAGEICEPHALTLRCSIIGPDPDKSRGLFEWFRQLPSGSTINGFIDQMWNGVTSIQLANLCREIIQNSRFDQLTQISPIRHFCPNTPISKYELLNIFNFSLVSGVVVKSVESGTPLNRILKSRWSDLNNLIGGTNDMSHAINEMITLLD